MDWDIVQFGSGGSERCGPVQLDPSEYLFREFGRILAGWGDKRAPALSPRISGGFTEELMGVEPGAASTRTRSVRRVKGGHCPSCALDSVVPYGDTDVMCVNPLARLFLLIALQVVLLSSDPAKAACSAAVRLLQLAGNADYR
jgi:hypothetical protein